MILMKAIVVVVAATTGQPTVTVDPQQAPPMVARCTAVQSMTFDPHARLDPSCVVDQRHAPAPRKGKAKRLPRARVVVQVGAKIRAHITAKV